MISDHEFKTSMKILSGAFPERKLDENTLLAYREGTKDLPESHLYLAAKKLTQQETYFPRVSAIRKTAEHIQRTQFNYADVPYDLPMMERLGKVVPVKNWNKVMSYQELWKISDQIMALEQQTGGGK